MSRLRQEIKQDFIGAGIEAQHCLLFVGLAFLQSLDRNSSVSVMSWYETDTKLSKLIVTVKIQNSHGPKRENELIIFCFNLQIRTHYYRLGRFFISSF